MGCVASSIPLQPKTVNIASAAMLETKLSPALSLNILGPGTSNRSIGYADASFLEFICEVFSGA
jgi:hypothetical protein